MTPQVPGIGIKLVSTEATGSRSAPGASASLGGSGGPISGVTAGPVLSIADGDTAAIVQPAGLTLCLSSKVLPIAF
jgi:hypothetical protein